LASPYKEFIKATAMLSRAVKLNVIEQSWKNARPAARLSSSLIVAREQRTLIPARAGRDHSNVQSRRPFMQIEEMTVEQIVL
jgi:hypothetical protein